MKLIYLFTVIGLLSCNHSDNKTQATTSDTLQHSASNQSNSDSVNRKANTDSTQQEIYSNKRFRNVTIKQSNKNTFVVKGEAQVFEAAFSWVIEDGHNELQKGHQMTDAGAPEWGKFSFTIQTKKENPNSTLTLILFEASPKDGSRQYELPIKLY